MATPNPIGGVMGALNWLLLSPAVTARLETSFARSGVPGMEVNP